MHNGITFITHPSTLFRTFDRAVLVANDLKKLGFFSISAMRTESCWSNIFSYMVVKNGDECHGTIR